MARPARSPACRTTTLMASVIAPPIHAARRPSAADRRTPCASSRQAPARSASPTTVGVAGPAKNGATPASTVRSMTATPRPLGPGRVGLEALENLRNRRPRPSIARL